MRAVPHDAFRSGRNLAPGALPGGRLGREDDH